MKADQKRTRNQDSLEDTLNKDNLHGLIVHTERNIFQIAKNWEHISNWNNLEGMQEIKLAKMVSCRNRSEK